MSLLWPQTRAEVKAAGWVFSPLLIVPQLGFLVLFWRLFFTSDAHLWTLGASLVLSLPLAVFVLRRASYLAEAGLHPYWGAGQSRSVKQRILVWLGMTYVLYFTGLMLLALHLVIFGEQTSDMGVVAEAERCTRKCLGCAQTATVDMGLLKPTVCTDGLASQPVPGSSLILTGRFTRTSLYVTTVKP